MNLCVSAIHPPLYSISASVNHQEGEERRRQMHLHCLPDRNPVGFCAPRVENRGWGQSRAEVKIISTGGLKCLGRAKFGLLIFVNSCYSFITKTK